jgi:hypothetical protein
MELNKELYLGKHCEGYTYQLEGSQFWRAYVTFKGHRQPVLYGANSKELLLKSLDTFDATHGTKLSSMKEARDERDKRKKVLRSQTQSEIVVGTLLHGSWGYDQTQCELFQVIGVTGFTVMARKIASRDDQTGNGMAAECWPIKDSFVGDPIRLRISAGGCKYKDYCRLTPSDWDRSYYRSWYG